MAALACMPAPARKAIRGWGSRSRAALGTPWCAFRHKRLLREAFRLIRGELPDLDMVVIPVSRQQPTLAAYQASLAGLARRIENRVRRASP